jgi:hypothetical protein
MSRIDGKSLYLQKSRALINLEETVEKLDERFCHGVVVNVNNSQNVVKYLSEFNKQRAKMIWILINLGKPLNFEEELIKFVEENIKITTFFFYKGEF